MQSKQLTAQLKFRLWRLFDHESSNQLFHFLHLPKSNMLQNEQILALLPEEMSKLLMESVYLDMDKRSTQQ